MGALAQAGADLDADALARRINAIETATTPSNFTGASPGLGRRVVRFGDSITDLNVARTPGLWKTSQRGMYTWADAMLGNPFYVVNQAGVSGDTLAMMLARVNKDVLAYSPDEVHMFGGVNDIRNVVPSTTSIANLSAILTALSGIKVVRLCTIPFFDTVSAQTQVFERLNKFISTAPLTWRNVIVHDIARGTDNPEQSGSTPYATQGFSVDGVHPGDLGAQRAARAWVADIGAVPPTFPLEGYNDWTWLSHNPRGAGSNASGANGFQITAGAGSGTGPDGWQLSRSSATGSGVISKVAHPTEAFRPGTIPQVAASFTALNDTLLVGPLDFSINQKWSSGGGASIYHNFNATNRNGVSYRCIVGGTFAVGSDPTASWSTNVGSTFTAGTATFQVVEEFVPGITKVRGVADVLVSSLTGSAAVELALTFYTAGYGSTLLTADGLSAGTPDSNTVLSYLPSKLTIVNPDIVIPLTTEQVSIRVRVRGSAGGAVTIITPMLGIQRWGN